MRYGFQNRAFMPSGRSKPDKIIAFPRKILSRRMSRRSVAQPVTIAARLLDFAIMGRWFKPNESAKRLQETEFCEKNSTSSLLNPRRESRPWMTGTAFPSLPNLVLNHDSKIGVRFQVLLNAISTLPKPLAAISKTTSRFSG